MTDKQLKFIGYCESRGITLPPDFLSENWPSPIYRYAVIETTPPSPRFTCATFETLEELVQEYREVFVAKDEPPASYGVIDIEDGLLYRIDEKGDPADPKPLEPYRPGDAGELKARQDARTRANLETTLKTLFGADYLTPHRRAIIDRVSQVEISALIITSDEEVKSRGDLGRMRIRIAHCRQHDDVANLVGELFDPLRKTPLVYMESYPWCVKYRLADSVLAHLAGGL